MALPSVFFDPYQTGARTPDLTEAACEQSTLKVSKVKMVCLCACCFFMIP